MTQATPSHYSISLREYIEKVIALRFDKLETLVDLRFEALKRALELQAVEYERRLTALNHEADRFKEMQAKFPIGLVVDQQFKELNGKNEDFVARLVEVQNSFNSQLERRDKDISAELEDLKLSRAELKGKASMGQAITGMVLAGLSILLSIVALIDKFGL